MTEHRLPPLGPGRPKITVETPLTRQEELYVEAVLNGSNRRQALTLAGYKLNPSMSISQINSKAKHIERRLNVDKALRERGHQRVTAATTRSTPAPIQPETFEPEGITPAYINQQSQFVFQMAVADADYAAGLRALSFMAEFNGLIAKKKPGRPAHEPMPNKGDVSGNYDDTDATAPREGADFDSLFGGFESGDGTGDPEGDEAFFKASTPRKGDAPTLGRLGPTGAANRRAERARANGAGISGETEGE